MCARSEHRRGEAKRAIFKELTSPGAVVWNLSFDLFLVWYFVVGFLLGNGVPHFVFGAAGKVFRSPFGQRSPPRTNIAWGLSNFIAATVIVAVLEGLNLYDGYALAVLMVGFWLTMLMFGTGIKRFLNE